MSPSETIQHSVERTESSTGTALLWQMRAPGVSGVAYASTLTGTDPSTVGDLALLSSAASDEAGDLLDEVEFLTRTLTATVQSGTERCVSSVRGPIQWGETITARANALGNEDVYVCSTASRSFNTVENRVLVTALTALKRAELALRTPAAELISQSDTEVVLKRSDKARRWLGIPRLRQIPTGRLTTRELAQFRRSRRTTRMHAVINFRNRQQLCLGPDQVGLLADQWSRALHDFVIQTLGFIVDYDDVPSRLGCNEGALIGGRIAFRHPATPGGGVPGLSLRGVPLLPPASVLGSAPWAGDLPAKGIVVSSTEDIARLMDHMGLGRTRKR